MTGAERDAYNDLRRIAAAAERIARALERGVWGTTAEEVSTAMRKLEQDAREDTP